MILITGSSGQLATDIVALARANGIDLLTASRSRASDRPMDFDRPDTLNFRGVETLFLTSAGYAEDDVVLRRHGAVLDAARDQGVRQVIYTSLTGAGDHLGFALAHRWTERTLRDSGLSWTILRNGLYAELIGSLAAPREGRIKAPLGAGGISAVGRKDLARAAVAVLAAPAAHVGISYELSGPVAFSASDLARHLGLPYGPLSLEEERTRLSCLPLLPFQPAMLMSIYSAARAGFLHSEESDLKTLVPHPEDALSLAGSAAQNAAES
ncbi:NmrA family transcriptional regulator [Paracoccus liaowanqingii]|uniref:NmrA family transcriptional regulator n=1 Tax=Paracoccus liaowanqingii TaxID=2560053 RepID=A0A4Z1CAN1_9RHOB|nr:NAD(P)H-binding protein [Paracoccus liaowanqingii]TGN60928.1 NmrA family transcriptional regulator [Paracoccus liaowanqingii]